jgi:hypothetical protein
MHCPDEMYRIHLQPDHIYTRLLPLIYALACINTIDPPRLRVRPWDQTQTHMHAASATVE